MGEENDQQEVAAKMQEAVFAKVVWEEEGMVKIVRILTDSAKDIDEDAYRMFMERIERMAPLGNKCLVYKDDEGDEVFITDYMDLLNAFYINKLSCEPPGTRYITVVVKSDTSRKKISQQTSALKRPLTTISPELEHALCHVLDVRPSQLHEKAEKKDNADKEEWVESDENWSR
eukprot:421337_1